MYMKKREFKCKFDNCEFLTKYKCCFKAYYKNKHSKKNDSIIASFKLLIIAMEMIVLILDLNLIV